MVFKELHFFSLIFPRGFFSTEVSGIIQTQIINCIIMHGGLAVPRREARRLAFSEGRSPWSPGEDMPCLEDGRGTGVHLWDRLSC